jgi:hypothetical protein
MSRCSRIQAVEVLKPLPSIFDRPTIVVLMGPTGPRTSLQVGLPAAECSVAVLQLGRRFLGVDQDKAAVSLTVERLSAGTTAARHNLDRRRPT